jgi:tRNA-2-methylthio-N6-dimethylallyladenosine synthase
VKKVFIQTFGCQMNKLDSEIVLGILADSGYEEARDESEADVILFNTCSVRRHAEDRVYSRIGALRRMKDKRPDLVVGVLGCMAQSEGRALVDRSDIVDLVCSPNRLKELPLLLQQVNGGGPVVAIDSDRSASRGAVSIGHGRKARARSAPWHAYVAVMTGCDNFCSYCVVPRIRGEELSRPPAEIVDEVKRLADSGCKEITLLGQNVNSYGSGLAPRVTLADLLAMLDPVARLERISFVTSHPKDLTRELLSAMAALPKVCEYLHVPPQSGSDRILKLMNRGYTSAHYRELLAMAREIVPGVELAGDFIVGFPGETEDDFAQTLTLLRDSEFVNCFVFKYSPRPNTAAAGFFDDVPDEVKRARNQALLDAQNEISLRKRRALIGRTVEVLVEGVSKRDPRRLTGRTRTNYIVHFESDKNLAGEFVTVRVTAATALAVSGEIMK